MKQQRQRRQQQPPESFKTKGVGGVETRGGSSSSSSSSWIFRESGWECKSRKASARKRERNKTTRREGWKKQNKTKTKKGSQVSKKLSSGPALLVFLEKNSRLISSCVQHSTAHFMQCAARCFSSFRPFLSVLTLFHPFSSSTNKLTNSLTRLASDNLIM